MGHLLWTRRWWAEWVAIVGVLALVVATQIAPLLRMYAEGKSFRAALATALVLVAMSAMSWGVHWRIRRSYGYHTLLLVAVQAGVVVALAFAGPGLDPAESLLGWLLLILLPRWWGWAAYVAVGAVMYWRIGDVHAQIDDMRLLYGVSPAASGTAVASSYFVVVGAALFLITGAVVYCLLLVARLGYQLRIARDDVARLAAGEERARIAQDLHDTLGQSLTVIAVHSELAQWQAGTDPRQCEHHLTTVQATTQAALEEMRRVARDTRVPQLERELAGARTLIEDVGAQCRLEIGDLPSGRSAEVLGWILREAVTNVLRHSEPSMCAIVCRTVGETSRLVVENDGVLDRAGHAPGTGLEAMAGRVRKAGGTFEARTRGNGRFRLVASIPAPRA
jgi:two-component system sensor histidine kinase DesK